MHYLIFVPHLKATSCEAVLSAVGLVDHIAGAELAETDGPTGTIDDDAGNTVLESGPGVLCTWRRPGEGGVKFAFEPPRQTWRPAVAGSETIPAGRYWAGIYDDSPPTPDDLVRPYSTRGHRVTMADRRPWLVPAPAELPRDMALQDDGSWRFEPQRQFAAFVADAFEWLKIYATADETTEIELGDAARFVCQALAINYRITPEIASMIGLFSTDTITPAMWSACGLLSSAGQSVEG